MLKGFNLDFIVRAMFLVFAFFLPIHQKISTISIILLLIVSLFNYKRENLNFNKNLIYPGAIYLLYCVSLFYSSEFQISIVEQKASLLVFPAIFFLNGNIVDKLKLNKIIKAFVLGCVLTLIICEITAIYKSFDFVNFLFDSRTNKKSGLYQSIVKEENLFFSYNFSYIHQTVYFAMYLLFSVSILFYNKVFNNNKIQKLVLFFLIIGILQTLNKAALIVLFVLLIIKIFKDKKKWKLAIVSAFIVFLVFILTFIFNPRFNTFYKSITERKTNIEVNDFKKIKNNNPNRDNFRIMLWKSATELISQNPILGIGGGGSHNRLYEVFAVKRQWYDKNEKYHTHNQFLQIFLDLGLVGFSIFMVMFFALFSNILQYNDITIKLILINFIVIICIEFFFESMFERYSGISFFSFFYCLFVSKSFNKRLA